MLISSGTHYTSDPDPVLISPHERTSDNGHAVHTEYSTVLSFLCTYYSMIDFKNFNYITTNSCFTP